MQRLLSLLCLLFFPIRAYAMPIDAILTWQTNYQPNGMPDYQGIEGSTDGSSFTEVIRVPPVALQYVATQEEGQATYWRVTAVNALGSAASNTACATIWRGLTPTLSLVSPVTGFFTVPLPTVDIAGIQYQIDEVNLGAEVTTPPFLLVPIDSRTLSNGTHTLTEIVRNTNGTLVTVATPFSVQNISTATLTYLMTEGSGTTVADSSGNGFNGTITGASWVAGRSGGSALAFTASGQRLASSLTAHNGQRSYLSWVKIAGAGGGGYGRIFDKRTTGAEVEALYYDAPANAIRYLRLWSGGVGSWSIPVPSLNVWHHIAVVYDAGIATNKPQMYVDGVSQSVTTTTQSNGTPLANTDPYVIGNRGDGGRWLNGAVTGFKIFNQLLSATDIQAAM